MTYDVIGSSLILIFFTGVLEYIKTQAFICFDFSCNCRKNETFQIEKVEEINMHINEKEFNSCFCDVLAEQMVRLVANK